MVRSKDRRRERDLTRRKPARPPYDRTLIVCEGRKTEKQYFDDIRIQNRIPSAHIFVVPSGYGTEPEQVLDFAIDTFEKTKEYECIFVVFDRDEHKTYGRTLKRSHDLNEKLVNDEGQGVIFHAIPSVPCFE